jgi:twitching motility protein PilI
MAKKQHEEDQPKNGATIPPLVTEEYVLPAEKQKPCFGFRVGSSGFMVSVNIFCEVLDKFQVNQLPNVQPWFSGLINLRGNLVPVFDLRRIMNESGGDAKKRRLFVIGRGDKAVALWIDNYPEILDIAQMLPLKQLPDLPPIFTHCISGAYLHNTNTWLDADLDKLFTMLGRHQYAMEETT